MLLSGKIEVFRNKKGYLTGVLKAFNEDKVVIGKQFVEVRIKDSKLAEKIVNGKTLTLDVETGYLDVKHVELEADSFDTLVVAINKAKVVKVFPEETKTTKKSKK